MMNRVLTERQIEKYMQFLYQEERAAATVEKYGHAIRSFARWLDGRAVTKERAMQWKNHLLNQRQAPSTINAKISALNGLFRFLGWNACRVKFLKLQRRAFRDVSRELSRAEYLRLLDAASHKRQKWLSLLIQSICSTGIRVSEVHYLTVEAAQSGQTVISLKGKIRTILLPGKLCRKLLRFAKRQKIASGEIFLTKDGRGLSRYQIWRAMKSLCVEAGVPPSKVFPHNLRHLFAHTFYRSTRDIVKLAGVLGHSSVETTRIYLLTTSAEYMQQLNQLDLVC